MDKPVFGNPFATNQFSRAPEMQPMQETVAQEMAPMTLMTTSTVSLPPVTDLPPEAGNSTRAKLEKPLSMKKAKIRRGKLINLNNWPRRYPLRERQVPVRFGY